ncbi:hypothetical protein M408DRAFT_328282 [Serendipita vermifera MAFF 305830]|uniref:Uncharacterized protein n=1 Tax=Serendipita vermifera MAFF 305830 TaxID=933852 RepID=A0A0C2WVP2_SERVB|nr:hypothetical protein M408DRAFT_328282 [Serendipita vermifera MAFF 305830]
MATTTNNPPEPVSSAQRFNISFPIPLRHSLSYSTNCFCPEYLSYDTDIPFDVLVVD